jgi:hypothetical protein
MPRLVNDPLAHAPRQDDLQVRTMSGKLGRDGSESTDERR